jgi:phosphoenolpyruvate carboxykinase (ATP)
MSLKHTRAIIDAIHDGSLAGISTSPDPIFGLGVPGACPEVPAELLVPRNTWADKDAFDRTANRLAGLFVKNFEKFKEGCSPEILQTAGELERAVTR